MTHSAAGRAWPSANAYSQAVQNPGTAFREPLLRSASAARDRLGMPLVMSGNFAYVFKLDLAGTGSRAVKCFRRALGDRAARFRAIDAHLEKVSLPQIARFEYEEQGIRVEGAWYPALVMEWVTGPTLDVYAGELVRSGNAAALRGLAEQFAQLVASLAEAGIAHGDLQHGNVIVTTGGLRLVDLDGMFVPALRAAGAPDEIGHRDYQHPVRTAADFDERLDRFSSLVIFTSLLALAEEPDLWWDFHDDGLVLTREDFTAPAASKALRRFAAHPGELRRLAETLVQACGKPLSAVPALTDLVPVRRSRLPLWLRQPVVPTVDTKTREARSSEIVAPSAPARPTFVLQPPAPVPAPPTPPPPMRHASRYASLSGPATGSPYRVFRRKLGSGTSHLTRWPPDPPLLRSAVIAAGVFAAIGVLFAACWWTLLDSYLGRFGLAENSVWRPVIIVTVYASACLAAGLLVNGWDGRISSLQFKASLGLSRAPGRGFVASTILCVYHRPDCPHAARIWARNRVWITHAYEAGAGGFRACADCSPVFS